MAAAGASALGIYLSQDSVPVINGGDIRIGSLPLGAIQSGMTGWTSGVDSVHIPTSLPYGRYYVKFNADDGAAIAETVEGNNVAVGPAVAIASPGALVAFLRYRFDQYGNPIAIGPMVLDTLTLITDSLPGICNCTGVAIAPGGSEVAIEHGGSSGISVLQGIFVGKRTGAIDWAAVVTNSGYRPVELQGWFPDGRTLLFTRPVDPSLPNVDLYTVRSDGTQLDSIPLGGDAVTVAAISRDGLHIAYRSAGGTLWAMDPLGGNRYQVGPTPSPLGPYLKWSPDGARLAAVDPQSNRTAQIADVTTGTVTTMALGDIGGVPGGWVYGLAWAAPDRILASVQEPGEGSG